MAAIVPSPKVHMTADILELPLPAACGYLDPGPMTADGKMDDGEHGATPRAAGSAASAPERSSVTFALVDVFAEWPLTGNPLAVVPDADWLDLEQMRRIARELNQVETTFLHSARAETSARPG
jgi:hypothetical protein